MRVAEGGTERFGTLRSDVPTLAELYAGAGYCTAAFVNNIYLSPTFGLDRGFHTYDYREEAPFGFPISAFGGSDDSDVPLAALEAWQEHTSTEIDVRLFPGGHFYLNDERPQLLRVLARALER